MRAFGGMTYLRADLPVRQEEAEAQRSREMSAPLLKTFGPVSHSLGKIVLAIHSQSLDAAITTSTMCQRVSRCFGKCPLRVRTHPPPSTHPANTLPDGQITSCFPKWPVQPHLQKYFRFRPTQIRCISITVPFRQEGRRASSRTRGGMRWTQGRQARMAIAGRDEPRERSASVQDDRRFSGRQSRVVPTPVAGAKLAEAKSSSTGFDEP